MRCDQQRKRRRSGARDDPGIDWCRRLSWSAHLIVSDNPSLRIHLTVALRPRSEQITAVMAYRKVEHGTPRNKCAYRNRIMDVASTAERKQRPFMQGKMWPAHAYVQCNVRTCHSDGVHAWVEMRASYWPRATPATGVSVTSSLLTQLCTAACAPQSGGNLCCIATRTGDPRWQEIAHCLRPNLSHIWSWWKVPFRPNIATISGTLSLPNVWTRSGHLWMKLDSRAHRLGRSALRTQTGVRSGNRASMAEPRDVDTVSRVCLDLNSGLFGSVCRLLATHAKRCFEMV